MAAQGDGGAETLLSRQNRLVAADYAEALAEPFVLAMIEAFPGAEILEVRRVSAPEMVATDNDEMED